jgi:F1F0 ATPase subunit 2
MMIEILPFAFALLFGALIGAAYFWVLWRSARAITASQEPWRAAAKGGGLRMALLFGSFALLVLVGANATEILAWLAGFLLARLTAVRLTKPIKTRREETRA